MGYCLSRQFSKEVQTLNKHVKKCSLSLAIRQMQIKTTLTFTQFLPQSEWLSARNQTIANAGKDGVGGYLYCRVM